MTQLVWALVMQTEAGAQGAKSGMAYSCRTKRACHSLKILM